MPDKIFEAECIKTNLGDIETFTFSMPVKDVIHIYYVAVRGIDAEDGAVQRPLSRARIEKIKDYVLDGNTFLNSFILNWTESENAPTINGNKIKFPITAAAAQAIDGQHRLAGLEAAIEEAENIGELEIIVTLAIGLNTKNSAKVFLNINTEQKPAPKSLVYDLFGEIESDPEHAMNRATDIARQLNDEEGSPLHRLLKFPGSARGVGKIELSTFVNAYKKHFEPDGEFPKVKLRTFEHQHLVIRNFFSALKTVYSNDGLWTNASQNPFFKAAGFNGASEFLIAKLLQKCAEKGSFTIDTMLEVMSLEEGNLLQWNDMKGLDGKTAKKLVTDYLEKGMISAIGKNATYSF